MVQSDFNDRISDLIDRLDATEKLVKKRRPDFKYLRIAAALVLVGGVSLVIGIRDNSPEDTFDDPMMAYAEVEKAFSRISMEVSANTCKVENMMVKQKSTVDNVFNNNK